MGGTVKRAVTAVATGGLSEFTHGPDAFGIKTGLSKLGWGSQGYTPTLLPNTDPVMQLAQTGGAPLLTNIALGASVDDALAGYFGRTSGADFSSWVNNLDPNERQAVMGIKNQLTQIQSNTDLRNQAVQKVINDFPNIVSQTSKAMINSGKTFDEATQGYLNLALDKVGAKYAAGNQLSSGAMAAASARTGAELGLEKLNYQTGFAQQDWQNQYNEANALRSFQQKMLGQGANQGFSAAQAALQRQGEVTGANTAAINQANAAKASSQNQFTGQLLGLAGTAGIYGMLGPGAAAAKGATSTDNLQGASAYGFSGPATPGYSENAQPQNFGINAGGYR